MDRAACKLALVVQLLDHCMDGVVLSSDSTAGMVEILSSVMDDLEPYRTTKGGEKEYVTREEQNHD